MPAAPSPRADTSSPQRRGPTAAAILLSLVAFGALSAPAAADESTERDLRLGRGLYDQQLFERALSPLERVRAGAASATEKEEALFLLGESYRSLDRLAEAEVRFGEFLALAPGGEWAQHARLGRGEALVRLDRPAEAVSILEATVAGGGEESAAARYWLAEAHARLGRSEEAIAGWRSLVESEPRHELAPFAAHNAALRLRDAGRPREGLALLDRLPREGVAAAERDRTRLLAGELALAAGDAARALAECRAIEDPQAEAAALAGQAWAARALGDAAALASARAKLAERHPESAERRDADLLAGSASAEAGEIEPADSALEPHLSGPRGDEARFWRGWARRAAGRPAEAAELFLAVSGDGAWAARAVLRAEEEWRKAERYREALLAARRFIETWPEDPRGAAVIAGAVESSYRLGEDERALELAGRFRERWPDDPLAPAVSHYAAEAALRRGDTAAAIASFELLWREPARRATVGPRFAWALSTAGTPEATARLAEIVPELSGSGAAEAGILLGRALAAAGDSAGALAAFRTAAAADPSGEAGARARLEEATLLGAAGGAGAEQAYRAVLAGSAAEPVRARARIDLASLLASRGEDGPAATEYARYLEEHPAGADLADAWLGLAFARFRLGQHDPALAAIAGLRAAQPPADEARRAEALYLEGRIQAAKGDAPAATRALTAYVENHAGAPRFAEALRELARIAEESGDNASARGFLERRIAIIPQPAGTDEAAYRLAWLELADGEGERAAARFRSFLAAYPDTAFAGDARFRLGEIAYEAGEMDAARREYLAAIASPDGARIAERARYRIGWSFRREEQWAESRRAFEELARAHPEGDLAGEALYLAADAAERSGDAEGELATLVRFLADHPEHERAPAAKVRVAERRAEKEEWAEVRKLLDPLRTVPLEEPWRTRHRIALGRALTRLGSARAALPILAEALAGADARAAEAQYEIGLAHRAAGDPARAIDAFIEGPVLYPFEPWAVRSHLEAARDLLATGKRKEAVRLLELAIERDRDGPVGREAKALLASPTGKDSL